MRFFPRLSESISDLVRRTEPDEVVGLIGGEGGRLDAKEVFEVVAIA